jgi:hypothetical protein
VATFFMPPAPLGQVVPAAGVGAELELELDVEVVPVLVLVEVLVAVAVPVWKGPVAAAPTVASAPT